MKKYLIEEEFFERKRILERGSYGRTYLAESKDRNNQDEFKVKIIECEDVKILRLIIKELLRMVKVKSKYLTNVREVKFGRNMKVYAVMAHEEDSGIESMFGRESSSEKLFSESLMYDFLEDITRGLHALHSKGIIHSHICPQSIKFVEEKGKKVFKIVDICRVDRMTGFSPSYESLCYQSPEIVANFDYGAEADIFSLGILCYNIMVDNENLNGSTFFFNKKKEDIISDLQVRGYTNVDLIKLIVSMISYPPEDRPSTTEILNSLKTFERLNRFTLFLQRDDLIVRIFQFLRPSKICNMLLVCPHWKVIGESDILWKFFFHRKFGKESHRNNWKLCYKDRTHPKFFHESQLVMNLENRISRTKEIFESTLSEVNNLKPFLRRSEKSLNTLSKKDIKEVKSMQRPSEIISKVVQSVVLLLEGDDSGKAKSREYFWKVLRDRNFLLRLIQYDNSCLEGKNLERIVPQNIDPMNLGMVSKASTCLYYWVTSQVNNFRVKQAAAPIIRRHEIAKKNFQNLEKYLELIIQYLEKRKKETNVDVQEGGFCLSMKKNDKKIYIYRIFLIWKS